MQRHKYASLILFIISILSAISISGCAFSGFNDDKNKNSTAISIALNYSYISSEIKNSNYDYTAVASPADPAFKGYYGYSGEFYEVAIDTANLIPDSTEKTYLGHFKALVDLKSKRVMDLRYTFDVSIMPETILLPAHSIWYQRLNPQREATYNLRGTYVEMKLDSHDLAFDPMIIPATSISMLKDGRPYFAFWLSELGENATVVNVNRTNLHLTTFLYNVTVIPGRMSLPGNFINGSGVSFTYPDAVHEYYFVLINNGDTDETVRAMIL
jgi:hypothetical protein